MSSILPRRNSHLQIKRREVNVLLKSLCDLHCFEFLDNDDSIILANHISSDGVHLNDAGTKVLQHSYLACLDFSV